jgi:predicted RNA polymerase sigma factor
MIHRDERRSSTTKRVREASDAYDRAIGLAEDPAVRAFLLQKRG